MNAWRDRFEQVCHRHRQGLAPGQGFAPGQGLGSDPQGYHDEDSSSGTALGMGVGVFNEDNDEGAGDECGWLAVPSVARRVRWEGEHAGVFAMALLAEPVVLCGLLKLSDALAGVLACSVHSQATQGLGQGLASQGLAPGLGQGHQHSSPRPIPSFTATASNGGGNNMTGGKASRIPHPLLLSLASLARSVLKARHTLSTPTHPLSTYPLHTHTPSPHQFTLSTQSTHSRCDTSFILTSIRLPLHLSGPTRLTPFLPSHLHT